MVTQRLLQSARSAAACATLLAGQAALQAEAAILYGDFSDVPPGTVMYTDVTESSSSDPVPPPLYGAPTIAGNLLDFTPVGFDASTTGSTPGADLTEGQLNFTMEAVPATGLTTLIIDEAGEFTLSGAGTSLTTVSAGIFAQVNITHVNGLAVTEFSVSGSASFSADLPTSPGVDQPWALSLQLDLIPALINAGYDPQVDSITQADVVVNNTLAALSEVGPDTTASISKSNFDVNVPEPGSLALLALGTCLVAARRRR